MSLGRHFHGMAHAVQPPTDPVQKAPCGGTHRMDPMRRAAPLDSKGMDTSDRGER
jgi:hypothetical protein